MPLASFGPTFGPLCVLSGSLGVRLGVFWDSVGQVWGLWFIWDALGVSLGCPGYPMYRNQALRVSLECLWLPVGQLLAPFELYRRDLGLPLAILWGPLCRPGAPWAALGHLRDLVEN